MTSVRCASPWVAFLLAVTAASCADSGQATLTSVVHLGAPTTFKPGEAREVGGMTIAFDGVDSDSRCATDVVCVTEGDATVRFSIGFTNREILAPIRLLELHTGSGGPHTASGYGYQVALTQLEPQPKAGVTIAPEDYRATVQVQPDTDAVRPAAGSRPRRSSEARVRTAASDD